MFEIYVSNHTTIGCDAFMLASKGLGHTIGKCVSQTVSSPGGRRAPGGVTVGHPYRVATVGYPVTVGYPARRYVLPGVPPDLAPLCGWPHIVVRPLGLRASVDAGPVAHVKQCHLGPCHAAPLYFFPLGARRQSSTTAVLRSTSRIRRVPRRQAAAHQWAGRRAAFSC